jgi:hypothetical protein
VTFLQGSMPPANPGPLEEQTYTGIAAFILDANGARNEGLNTVIRVVATGPVRRSRQASSVIREPKRPRLPFRVDWL